MPAERPPDWRGRTVACIASGPSLTQEDCNAVRHLSCVVANSSFRAAPWAEVLFGFDLRWWRAHIDEVRASGFRGRLFSTAPDAYTVGVESVHRQPWFRQHGNSGACCIAVAIAARARRVILLGFDCMKADDGRVHWHPDHPAGFSNGASMKRWPYHFKKVAEYARENGVEVINCSRRTALDCFKCAPLSEALLNERSCDEIA